MNLKENNYCKKIVFLMKTPHTISITKQTFEDVTICCDNGYFMIIKEKKPTKDKKIDIISLKDIESLKIYQ